MFPVRTTFGDLVASYSCGIICGVNALWESEGSVEVDESVNLIWPEGAMRPELLFYDLACRRRIFLQTNPDPTWAGTRLIVDRFHFATHR
ncbi:unnamed protein product [Pylaiella littoralis]